MLPDDTIIFFCVHISLYKFQPSKGITNLTSANSIAEIHFSESKEALGIFFVHSSGVISTFLDMGFNAYIYSVSVTLGLITFCTLMPLTIFSASCNSIPHFIEI